MKSLIMIGKNKVYFLARICLFALLCIFPAYEIVSMRMETSLELTENGKMWDLASEENIIQKVDLSDDIHLKDFYLTIDASLMDKSSQVKISVEQENISKIMYLDKNLGHFKGKYSIKDLFDDIRGECQLAISSERIGGGDSLKVYASSDYIHGLDNALINNQNSHMYCCLGYIGWSLNNDGVLYSFFGLL